MFGIANSPSEFKEWAKKIEGMLSIEPCVNFMVAYASLERYLFRIALALKIFMGEHSKDARKQLENTPLESLVGFCSNPNRGGKPDLRNALSKIGLDTKTLEVFRNARNKLVHGADIGDRNINKESANLFWKGLRQISEIEFGNIGAHPKAPYGAWQHLPVRRRKAKL